MLYSMADLKAEIKVGKKLILRDWKGHFRTVKVESVNKDSEYFVDVNTADITCNLVLPSPGADPMGRKLLSRWEYHLVKVLES